MVSIKEFQNFELIVAQVKEVKDHPNADKLYVLKIDTGAEIKQIVAGIRLAYAKEALVGRKIIVVNNLEPAMLRGEESCGMLLAASDENGPSVLEADRNVKIGSRVK
ncbi:MAG TPA: methionine--tRNA ligase subunit beta [Candidatus Omnitrophota bacterium]|nr:methionine--tRNA ligase subunit beta [Candidatus Omnitrophota bacterium]